MAVLADKARPFTGVPDMSQSPSRPINRIPQYIILLAAAALIVFLFLLGTDTVTPDGPTTLIIGSVLAGTAFVATMLEIGLNQTGQKKTLETDQQ
jgi:hypothetical protein